jgi:hypothetical protein
MWSQIFSEFMSNKNVSEEEA